MVAGDSGEIQPLIAVLSSITRHWSAVSDKLFHCPHLPSHLQLVLLTGPSTQPERCFEVAVPESGPGIPAPPISFKYLQNVVHTTN
jgi:hypothetical protein